MIKLNSFMTYGLHIDTRWDRYTVNNGEKELMVFDRISLGDRKAKELAEAFLELCGSVNARVNYKSDDLIDDDGLYI